jgi:hypothetical protein
MPIRESAPKHSDHFFYRFDAKKKQERFMRKMALIILVTLAIIFSLTTAIYSQMQSTNYRITTSVVSGGGGQMGSSSYLLNGTLGQPSPLIDPADPPWSSSYDLLTGFWYTLDAAVEGCGWDIEPEFGDGDVDGADLSEFINRFDEIDLPAFASEFGKDTCF